MSAFSCNYFRLNPFSHIAIQAFLSDTSYDGFYANKSGAKYNQAAKCWEPLSKVHSKTSWRERQWARNKRDPLTCKHPEAQMEHDRESELFLKDHYAIASKNPLFFQCVHCKTGLIKPIGYAGEPLFVVDCDESNDSGSDFQNLLSF